MRFSRSAFLPALAALVLVLGAGPAAAAPVDGFEGGLPSGRDASNNIRIGFYTFRGVGTATIATTSTPPADVPGAAPGNTVLRMDVNASTFAGFVHVFENTAVNALAPRDWSSFDAITFWLYGNNSGVGLYTRIGPESRRDIVGRPDDARHTR